MKCHILDSLTQPGGQCIELYPKKPIYDIPGYPEIIAGDLIENLLEQIKPFQPSYTLGETALNLDKLDDGSFKIDAVPNGSMITVSMIGYTKSSMAASRDISPPSLSKNGLISSSASNILFSNLLITF